MSRERSLRRYFVSLAGVCAALALVLASPASGDPAASASAPEAGSASASASADAKPPPPPVVHGSDIPQERSPAPKPQEWAQAKIVSPTRPGARCTLKLIREWLRAECTDEFGAGLIAGSPKDVHVWAGGDLFGWDEATQQLTHSTIVIDVPIERGQSRIFTIVGVEAGDDWGGVIPSDGGALHVEWRPGAADPVILFT
ncbi:MAG TPA: hypothetical protein VL400_13620 [Polyangiaceae bacterium]|nr:hypothetical protein [Polyangiaceae bacterium]